MTTISHRFAVLLCSHNGAKFIREQIESIFAQGSCHLDLYVHDFASTDETRDILNELVATFSPHLHLNFHDSAPGAAKSFLIALDAILPKIADNAFVLFSDQDDVWKGNKISSIAAFIDKKSLDPGEIFCIFHDVDIVDSNLRLIRESYYHKGGFQIPRDLDIDLLFLANPVIGHTMILSLPLAKKINAWPDTDYCLMHDWLAVLMAGTFGRIHFLPAPLSLYRQHSANLLGDSTSRKRRLSTHRVVNFCDAIVKQAVGFAKDLSSIAAGSYHDAKIVAQLTRNANRPRRIAWILATVAALRGPRLRTKLLSLIIFARSFSSK